MTGYELRLWRRGLNWTQERAAEELDISLRTYKRYEINTGHSVSRLTELATRCLSLQHMLPELSSQAPDRLLMTIRNALLPLL